MHEQVDDDDDDDDQAPVSLSRCVERIAARDTRAPPRAVRRHKAILGRRVLVLWLVLLVDGQCPAQRQERAVGKKRGCVLSAVRVQRRVLTAVGSRAAAQILSPSPPPFSPLHWQKHQHIATAHTHTHTQR